MSDDPSTDPTDTSSNALDVLRGWFEETSTTEDGPDLDALSGRERGALKRSRVMGTLLDEAIQVPGIGYRVGIDPILSIVPVSGDIAAAALSMHIVAESARVGVPRKTLLRMLVNIAIDTGAGSVPIAGDLFDVVWKANTRNVSLLEKHLAERADISAE